MHTQKQKMRLEIKNAGSTAAIPDTGRVKRAINFGLERQQQTVVAYYTQREQAYIISVTRAAFRASYTTRCEDCHSVS